MATHPKPRVTPTGGPLKLKAVKAPVRVIVEVIGGIANRVYSSDPNISVSILDWDNINGSNPDDKDEAKTIAEGKRLEAEAADLHTIL